MVTYGDGVCDVDLSQLLAFHRAHGRLATVTGIRPTSRFGELNIDGDRVATFFEKPDAADNLVNGGFFVFERGCSIISATTMLATSRSGRSSSSPPRVS